MADHETCNAHTPGREERGFALGGNTRTATPKFTERLLQRVDERIDEILCAYFDNLRNEDPDVQMKAATHILNRALGTPKQSVDVAHSGGLSLEALLSPDPLTPTNSELPEEGE